MKTKTQKFNPATAMNVTTHNLKTRMGAIILGVALFCIVTLSAHAADQPARKLRGHVPAIVPQLKAKHDLSADTDMTLAIGLPLRNTVELTNLLQQIYDPSSPNYHRYLTPDEFAEKFGPTKQDYQMVMNFARAHGFAVKGTHSNRMLLDVTGKAADVERAFGVKLHVYQHPKDNREFFAPDTEPTVNANLPILDISGLDSYHIGQPKLKVMQSPKKGAVKAGSGAFGAYMGDDFRNAYAAGSSLNGAGQTVGLFEEDGYFANDIVQYEALAGRTNVPLQNILIDGVSGVPGYSGFSSANEEVALDIEMVIAMAPAVSKVIVYEGPIFSGQNDILNRMATDNAARQLSCSWGWSGGPSATTDQIFQQMALQGQSFFDASGDVDAFTAGANSSNGIDNPNTFNAPSDSPYITQVGGTTLSMNGNGASYASETVWNWGVEFGIDGVGSSGGISSFYAIPSWQTNINMSIPKGSSTFRNTPDVAAVADNIVIVADNGFQEFVGGTSAAAPLWAGFMALANQQATNNGHGPAGFINPLIYSIATSPNYTNCFHDVVTGNNEWSGSPALFVATNNYDLCTGLGTPNGTNLINALAGGGNNGITHLSPPQPPYNSTLSALSGGNPNGTWQLFVLDDATFNSGMISNGWILKLTTANIVGSSADLALGMSESIGVILVSNTVTYSLVVTNYGPSTASNALVADTLPLNAVVVSAVPTQGTITHVGQSLNWTVGNLSTNTGSQLTLTLRFPVAGNLLNFATASATTPDANFEDDFASAAVTVLNPTPPQVSNFALNTNGVFQVTISGPAVPVIIQASTNLVNWTSLYTNTPPFTFTDTNAANFPTRYYRSLLQ